MHDTAQIARFLRREFPEVVADTIAQADLALRGELILPGTGGKPAFVGDPPRWREILRDDPEYLWTLNRMEHWATLLKAWALTARDEYAAKVVAEIDDWIEKVPPPCLEEAMDESSIRCLLSGPIAWRMLEVGIRMYLSWSYVPRFLNGTPWLNTARASKFEESVARHGTLLANYSPVLWPGADHNHYMMEMLGLLCAALLHPSLSRASDWRDQSLRELTRCCERQFTESGGQIEGCPHYHAVCVGVLARAVGVAREYGQTDPPALTATLRRSMDYLLHATRPNGEVVPWGDSDPSSVAMAVVQGAAALDDVEYVRLAAALTGAQEMKRTIGQAAWEIEDPEAMLAASMERPSKLPARVAWHHGLDQVSARTGWTRHSASIFFACRTPVNNGHAHIDPGAFDYVACGKPLLVDPARQTYRPDDERYRFKCAAAHNMLTIDDSDPFEYLNLWDYGPQREGRILSMTETATGDVVMVAEHANYSPALHRRTIVLRADGMLVIADRVARLAPGRTVQRWFHFDSQTVVWRVEESCARSTDREVNIALFTSECDTVDVLPGQISRGIDISKPSRRLRLESVGAGDAFSAIAVACPYLGAEPPEVSKLWVTADGFGFSMDGHENRWLSEAAAEPHRRRKARRLWLRRL